MPLNRPTLNTIVERIEKSIESRLFGNVALLRRAIARILARVFAGAVHTNYGSVEWLSDQLFVTTAEEEFLTRHGKAWGVNRRSGSFATGTVNFTGTNGVIVPADTIIQDDNGIEYGTLAEVTITGGNAAADIQAVEVGTDANKTYDGGNPQYLQLIEPIENLDNQAEITGDIEGGIDQEELEAWRERILFRIQQPPMGGTAADYIAWSLEVNGVGRAWSYPLANGPGTVAVAIITSDETSPAPPQQLLDDVAGYLETKAPVTADVSVVSVTNTSSSPGTAAIFFGMEITPDTSDVRNAITENIKDLFAPHKPGDDILISQIRGAITAAGVTDFNIWEIMVDFVNVETDEDIEFSGYEYPTLDSITFGS